MLVQKTTTIQLPTPARVQKLICVDISTILIITAKSIAVYDITSNCQLSISSIDDWDVSGTNTQQDSLSILEAVFHSKAKHLFILLSRKPSEKHKNWIFISTSLSGTNGLSAPTTLLSFENSMTKYEKMELQPRIIVFPQSEYFVLLRQFYNDSMIVVFQHAKQVTSFFANQENMAEFDEKKTLVSFRALFEGRILFELFDIQADGKNTDKKGERKASTKLQLNVNKSGVVIAIKKICVKSAKNMSQQGNSQIFGNNENKKQNSLCVIAVNWRNKSIQYIVFDYKSSQIINLVSNIKQNALLLSFFTLTKEHKICTLLFKQGKISLGYENISTSSQQKIKCDHQIYEANQQLEQWDFYRVNNNDFIVVNYSQPLRNEKTLNCHLYRNFERKEAIVRLAMQKNIMEGLIQQIVSLCLG